MRVLLLATLALSAEIALGLSSASTKALSSLGKCLPSTNFSCVAQNNCTQAQFCAVCSTVKSSSAAACTDKSHVYAAVEGLFGKTEGGCSDVCAVGDSVSTVRAKASYKAGDEVLVLQNAPNGKTGLGLVVSNGAVSIADMSYSGPRKAPGTILTLDDAISSPIASVSACFVTAGNTLAKSCFTSLEKCSPKGLSKEGRCAVCKSTSSCTDRSDFVGALFGMTCTGC